jgi:hypothetical protein
MKTKIRHAEFISASMAQHECQHTVIPTKVGMTK